MESYSSAPATFPGCMLVLGRHCPLPDICSDIPILSKLSFHVLWKQNHRDRIGVLPRAELRLMKQTLLRVDSFTSEELQVNTLQNPLYNRQIVLYMRSPGHTLLNTLCADFPFRASVSLHETNRISCNPRTRYPCEEECKGPGCRRMWSHSLTFVYIFPLVKEMEKVKWIIEGEREGVDNIAYFARYKYRAIFY